MRVLYLSHVLNIHDLRFLTSLAGTEHEIRLATLYNQGTIPSAIAGIEGLEITHRPFSFFPALSPECRLTKPGVVRRRLGYRGDIGAATRWLRGQIAEFRPDLVHAGWAQGDGYLAARTGFHPTLLMPWGSDILLAPARSLRDRRLALAAIRHADAITCCAPVIKQRIQELHPVSDERFTVFPWGIDLDRFTPEGPREEWGAHHGWRREMTLIMTRQFLPVYGIDVFLHALASLRERVPEARAVLLGGGRLLDDMRALARRLDLDGHVHMPGPVDSALLPAWLRSCGAFVSSSYSDAASLSLIEAMACGLPAVVSDLPGNHAWVGEGEGGLLTTPGDAAALAEALARMLGDEDFAKRCGARNVALARERADWPRNFAKLLDRYRSLAAAFPRDAHPGRV